MKHKEAEHSRYGEWWMCWGGWGLKRSEGGRRGSGQAESGRCNKNAKGIVWAAISYARAKAKLGMQGCSRKRLRSRADAAWASRIAAWLCARGGKAGERTTGTTRIGGRRSGRVWGLGMMVCSFFRGTARKYTGQIKCRCRVGASSANSVLHRRGCASVNCWFGPSGAAPLAPAQKWGPDDCRRRGRQAGRKNGEEGARGRAAAFGRVGFSADDYKNRKRKGRKAALPNEISRGRQAGGQVDCMRRRAGLAARAARGEGGSQVPMGGSTLMERPERERTLGGRDGSTMVPWIITPSLAGRPAGGASR